MTTNLNGTFAAVQAASRELALLSDDTINQILNAVADAAIAETPFIPRAFARSFNTKAERLSYLSLIIIFSYLGINV